MQLPVGGAAPAAGSSLQTADRRRQAGLPEQTRLSGEAELLRQQSGDPGERPAQRHVLAVVTKDRRRPLLAQCHGSS